MVRVKRAFQRIYKWEKDGCIDSKEKVKHCIVACAFFYSALVFMDKVDFLWVIFVESRKTRSKLLH